MQWIKKQKISSFKNKNYFSAKSLWEMKELKVEKEKDYYDNEIGVFVEYDLDKNDLLTDYSKLLESELGREAFLRMVFDREIYNILFEHSLVKRIDGSFRPINPFCCNDVAIVKGHLKDKNGKCYDREHFLDALLRYRSSALKISNICVMNRVSFGLAVLLLQKENTGVDALQLDRLVDDEWFQSQLLKNWAENCKDSIEALTFITDRWQKENDYCIRSSNKRKNSGEKNIEDHEIQALDFYPLKSEMDWIYLMMGCENPNKVYILHGKVQEDGEGDLILGIDLTFDICGNNSANCSDVLSQAPERLIEIMLGDIIEKNTCTIEVHGYYGTETGKKAIELFLQEQGIKRAAVTYEKEIVNHASQIISETKCIWPKTRDDVYTVVREFNMTKGNVFPNEMLSNPKKAICMFVKKGEIIKAGI